MSAWRTRFDIARKKQKRTNQDKHERNRDARHEKQTCPLHSHYVSPIVVLKHAAVRNCRRAARHITLGRVRFSLGVFLSSGVTAACPVTTDLIMRVNVGEQQQQQQQQQQKHVYVN